MRRAMVGLDKKPSDYLTILTKMKIRIDIELFRVNNKIMQTVA